jgi:hypothetical protein
VRVREAKDFLVQQTAEQSQLEGVPFSGLERRMMYFTEIEEMPEDPIQLNEEFEAEYDSDEYEAKISKLLHHAHARIKKENPEAARQWNQAVKVLNEGDHYLSVLWSENSPTERPPYDSLKMLGTALGMIALVLLGVFVSGKLEPQWRWLQKNIPRPNPHLLFGVFVAFILAVFLFPRALGNTLNWLVDKTLSRFLGPWKDDKDSE